MAHEIQAHTREEEIILKAIREDPFYTIFELKAVAADYLSDGRLGWWRIFKILKRHKLISRRSRFRYSRQFSRKK